MKKKSRILVLSITVAMAAITCTVCILMSRNTKPPDSEPTGITKTTTTSPDTTTEISVPEPQETAKVKKVEKVNAAVHMNTLSTPIGTNSYAKSSTPFAPGEIAQKVNLAYMPKNIPTDLTATKPYSRVDGSKAWCKYIFASPNSNRALVFQTTNQRELEHVDDGYIKKLKPSKLNGQTFYLFSFYDTAKKSQSYTAYISTKDGISLIEAMNLSQDEFVEIITNILVSAAKEPTS